MTRDMAEQMDPRLGQASQGSVHHWSGMCNPCAWFWKKQGCESGIHCVRCHLCLDGEVKLRKKAKLATMRASRAAGKVEGTTETLSVPVRPTKMRAPPIQETPPLVPPGAWQEPVSAFNSAPAEPQASKLARTLVSTWIVPGEGRVYRF